jgi:tetratricopeptide (TPR) repeat protein
MDKNTVLIAAIALLAGFIGGFLLANNMNRSEMNELRAGVRPAGNSNTAPGQPAGDTLSPEEIRAKLAEADASPDNFAFQKSLGVALYRYGAMKQDLGVLEESVRILTRASSLNAKDFDVLMSLGHAHFDVGFAKRDQKQFDLAREAYNKALAIRPEDADVRADLGISYFVQPTPDLAKAAAELQKVSEVDPSHDRSMQFLAEIYIKQNKIADAERVIAKIKEINASNPAVAQLESMVAEAKKGGLAR